VGGTEHRLASPQGLLCLREVLDGRLREERSSGPQAVLNTLLAQKIDIDPESKVTDFEFQLSNLGGQPLEFKLSTDCSCTVAVDAESPLLPGEQTTLRIQYSVSRQRLQFEQTVLLSSNDIANPLHLLRIAGNLDRSVILTPSTLDFGTLQVGSAGLVQRLVYVRNQSLTDDVEVIVERCPDWLTAKRADTLSPIISMDTGVAFAISVLEERLPKGQVLHDHIVFRFPSDNRERSLSVTGWCP
jgi:hypothetical protein